MDGSEVDGIAKASPVVLSPEQKRELRALLRVQVQRQIDDAFYMPVEQASWDLRADSLIVKIKFGPDYDPPAQGSQREQIGDIKKIISEISKQFERIGVPAEKIYAAALENGIDESRVKTLIKRLAQNGEVYSPQPGLYKLAREG